MKGRCAGSADGRRQRDGKHRTPAMALVRTTWVGDLAHHHNAASGREALRKTRMRRSGSLALRHRQNPFRQADACSQLSLARSFRRHLCSRLQGGGAHRDWCEDGITVTTRPVTPFP